VEFFATKEMNVEDWRQISTNTHPPMVSAWFKFDLPKIAEINLLQNEWIKMA
jgi:hypothetical protein